MIKKPFNEVKIGQKLRFYSEGRIYTKRHHQGEWEVNRYGNRVPATLEYEHKGEKKLGFCDHGCRIEVEVIQ